MRTLKFDSFVLPFSIGLLILTVIVIFRFSVWINKLPKSDKAKLLQGIFSRKIFSALKEIFLESLLHRKIFKINPVLGYMHTSLAFGWFLLIVIGNLESRLHNATDFNPPYFPIFFRFFVHEHVAVPFHGFFPFIMDFLLLIVLSGVVLALIKRVYSGLFGMKRKSKLKVWDKVALTALWFIFPMRLMAESFTAGVYKTGGFMTGTLGNRFSEFLPVAELAYISWWAYSLTLGAFFVFLPFSRYMHIPTEVLLIFLRKAGIKTGREHSSYSDIEVYSCPKCGICLDKCQISFVTGIKQIQSVYFLQSVRNKCINNDDMYNCLLCGRCTEYCPVGIDLNAIRMNKRNEYIGSNGAEYHFRLLSMKKNIEVAYFAGCMTHLSPSIKRSMIELLELSDVSYSLLDENGSICCGKPLLAAGRYKEALLLIDLNTEMINECGAKKLVVSCPICHHIFKNDYKIQAEVVHHSQFLLQLCNDGRISLKQTGIRVVYHDPCELGRNSGIYDEPRQLLMKFATLVCHEYEKGKALCCGGSLGNLRLSLNDKASIAAHTVAELSIRQPEFIVTACPLCKKTMAPHSPVPVRDIAEIITCLALSTSRRATGVIHGRSISDKCEIPASLVKSVF